MTLSCILALAVVGGVVLDPQGASVPGATVQLVSARGTIARSAITEATGTFRLENVEPGSYELAASAQGFQVASRSVRVASSADAIELRISLTLGPVAESVTITTSPWAVENTLETPQTVSQVGASARAASRATVLPQLFRDQSGLHVQQTTAHQGSVAIRGLTGQQVLTLIDGVRFNNATFRPGPNQYQALFDPSLLERVEVARGPNGVQYGSDSLGGTVNIVTKRASYSGGSISSVFSTADQAGGGDLTAFFGGERAALTVTGFGHRVNDLRAGRGVDSHSAVSRFLGLPSALLGTRLQDTGFTGFGGSARVGIKFDPRQDLSLYYARGQQQGGRRYDQLNGGNGSLRSGFDPQVLDFFYGRYERTQFGWLDSLAATISFNRIRDDRQTQSGDPASPITFDFARTDSRGYQGQATSHVGSRQVMGWGAELFDESVRSRMHRLNPASGVAGPPERPRFPNRARYRSFAAYLQDTAYLAPGRWRLSGGVRYSAFRYNDPAGVLMRTDDLTYHAGSSYFLTPELSLNAIASRGFRAPNIADLSQIGLTSSGFEVAPDSLLRPESLVNYETGLKLHRRGVTSEVSYFVAGIHDFITKRTLVLPAGAVGRMIGGERIVFQDPTQGWVRVAVDGRPVATRANVGEIRISGIEVSQSLRLSSDWTLRANFFRLRGRDRATSAPPELEGGLPPATGHLSLRYHPGPRWWLEAASSLAGRQDRLSSLELADQRMGASRTRAGIANYFNNGARARGLVANGVLLATGETLAQVQDRVLGPGVASAVWYRSTPGYAIFHVRAGVQLTERSTLGLLLENLLDKNYRSHGSGIDGAGLHAQVRYTIRF